MPTPRLPTAPLRSLTGLRFVAALFVVLLHGGQRFQDASWATSVAGFGYTGVSFFFMLSGFVLAWTHRPDDTPRRFYWRRFARVWPLHALTTGAAILVGLAAGLPLYWPALPAVLTLTQSWFPGPDIKYAFNGPSWSLACEMFFYLLFPVIVGPLSRLRRPLRAAAWIGVGLVVVGGACAAVFPTRELGNLLYTMPPYRLGEFGIGILLAAAIRRGWRPRARLRVAALVTVLLYTALMVGALAVLGTPERLPYFVADLWMLPGYAAVIAAAASGDLRGDGGFIRSGVMVKLGQWSFALYLVHELVLKLMAPLAASSGTAVSTAMLAGAVVVSVGVSAALYEWFERPVETRLRGLLGTRPRALVPEDAPRRA
jgi:peptidoglycan/LPS O-acetylase OafA/YrhL